MSKSCDNNYQRACTKWARQWKRPSFNISEVHAPSYYDFIVYNLTRVFVNQMFKHFSATLSIYCHIWNSLPQLKGPALVSTKIFRSFRPQFGL